MEPVISRPGEGELIENEDRRLFVKGSCEQMDFLEYEGGPDYDGAGPHFHKLHVDSFYVLEGTSSSSGSASETHRAARRDASSPCLRASSTPSRIRAQATVRFLNVHAPASASRT